MSGSRAELEAKGPMIGGGWGGDDLATDIHIVLIINVVRTKAPNRLSHH